MSRILLGTLHISLPSEFKLFATVVLLITLAGKKARKFIGLVGFLCGLLYTPTVNAQQICGWLENAYRLLPTGRVTNSIDVSGASPVTVPILSTVWGGCGAPKISLDPSINGFVGISIMIRNSQCTYPTCFDEYLTPITIQNTNDSKTTIQVGYVIITAPGPPDPCCSNQWQWPVNEYPLSALAITTQSLPDASIGKAYTASLAASGGTPPYSWSATGQPDGFKVTGDSLTSTDGAKPPANTYNVTITVRDSSSTTAVKTLPLTVKSLCAKQDNNYPVAAFYQAAASYNLLKQKVPSWTS